ncbi:TraB/GumN family protein [Sphingomonas sp.]|uniref:TraB/GumN family protein n=1 Tax=Sphingomonas sp. TaxID=28214 RepID=UPI003D6CF9EF
MAAAFALLATACDRPAIEARPALWRVQDKDTTIWLLGTVHVLPPNVRWETPAIDAAIDGADMLVTEIPAQPPEQAASAFAAATRADGLPPVADRVPAGQREQLARAARAAGISIDALDGMKSWAAAVTLGAGESRAMGATVDHGVEAVVARRFAAAGKPRRALETQAGQLAMFDALPEAAQRVLLLRAVEQPDGYHRTLAAWRSGDTARIAATFEPGFRGAPALENALVADRNRRWSGWIARRMNTPGTVLVAVGAGHLAGNKSVVAMLQAQGLRVERVQ